MSTRTRLSRLEQRALPNATQTRTIAPTPDEVEVLTSPDSHGDERAAVLARYGLPAGARTFGPIVTGGPVVCVQTGPRAACRITMMGQTLDF
jgi:hypothetical protein